MPLRLVVDSLTGISEHVAEHYSQGEDGKFYLQTEAAGGLSVDNVGALKTELATARGKHEKATAKLAKFDDMDPEAARDALAKVGSMHNWTPEEKVTERIKAERAAVEKKYKADLAAVTAERDEFGGQLKRGAVRSAAAEAIALHKGNPHLLLPIVADRVRAERGENGEFRTRVIGANGEPLVTARTGSTDPMSVAEYVESLRNDENYSACFDGAGASGGGSQGGKKTTAVGGKTKKLSAAESDTATLSASLEDIAAGKVVVTD